MSLGFSRSISSMIAKRIRWPENKSLWYESSNRKDKCLNPLLTVPATPPPRSLSSHSGGGGVGGGGGASSSGVDSSSSGSGAHQHHHFKHSQKMGQWQPSGYNNPAPQAPANLWPPGTATIGHQLPLEPTNNTELRYYYIHETLTILTFSIVFCLWFYVYGVDRDKQQQQQPTPSQGSTSRRASTDSNAPNQKTFINDLEMKLYNMLPLRATSSLWGKINSYDLPIWMRSRLYDFFCRTYDCDMSEALESDYRNYKNLSEFFSRRLKPDSRPISKEPGVVSPADGLILHFGPIQDGRIEGVKGLNYSVQAFLGLPSKDYERELIVDKENNELYNCIIYLAPGDYHRFHSPAEWLVNHRKHFPGRLLSVRPSLMKRLPEVLHINERVCYFGSWAHGFFSMTAVGATNVGSIKVNFDEDLRTNRRHLWRPDKFACFEHKFDNNLNLQAGQDFGEFNFGSTIVLIFEAPKSSTFDMKANQKIKYGQLMARIEPPAPPPTATN